MEKKNISMVSINAILHNITKPGIAAKRRPEIRAVLGPYNFLAYSKTTHNERSPKVNATNLAESKLAPIALKNRAVVTSNSGG